MVRKSTWEFTCEANPDTFEESWETLLSSEEIDIIKAQHGLPCEGSGHPGFWCVSCHWGSGKEIDTEGLS